MKKSGSVSYHLYSVIELECDRKVIVAVLDEVSERIDSSPPYDSPDQGGGGE